MIQTLRKKFILATMLSLLLVLLLILLPVNVVNYRKTVTEADRILTLLSENQGAFPQQLFPAPDRNRQNGRPGERPLGRKELSPEIPFDPGSSGSRRTKRAHWFQRTLPISRPLTMKKPGSTP